MSIGTGFRVALWMKQPTERDRRDDGADALRDDESRRIDGPDTGKRIRQGARKCDGRVREIGGRGELIGCCDIEFDYLGDIVGLLL